MTSPDRAPDLMIRIRSHSYKEAVIYNIGGEINTGKIKNARIAICGIWTGLPGNQILDMSIIT